MSLPPSRKLEWETERRLLSSQKQLAEQRIRELDEMLAIFFPKEVANG